MRWVAATWLRHLERMHMWACSVPQPSCRRAPAMSQTHRTTLIFAVSIVASIPASRLLRGDSCACPCGPNGSCLWDAQLVPLSDDCYKDPTYNPEDCKCDNEACSVVHVWAPLEPGLSQWVSDYGSPPAEDCCQTGCLGYCCDYFQNPCQRLWVCRTEDLEACDQYNQCRLQQTSTIYYFTAWFWTNEECCYDAI